MEATVLNIVNQVLTNRGKNPVTQLQVTDNLRTDIGFDSLDLAELTVRIEAEYDVDIFENGLIQTIGEIFEILKKQQWTTSFATQLIIW